MQIPGSFIHLNKITVPKAVNAARVLASYYHSRLRARPFMKGLPVNLSIEPTTSCNLRCPECPSGLRAFTRPTGMMDFELFTSVIDQVEDHLLHLLLYFQGEPYLHKRFFDLVEYATSRGIYTATSTNAHYLTPDNARATVDSGLSELIISIDGTTQDTYEQYRIGGSLEKVIDGTQNIIQWKKKLNSLTPHVVFQYLVVKPNEHQVEDVREIARSIGVNKVVFKTAQIYNYENGSPLLPDNPRFSRYQKRSDGKYYLKNELLDHCWKMWHSCVITWDGKVVPCCFDKDATHVMGDLQSETLKEIWFSRRYDSFRESILRSRSEIEICKNCTEGTKVWA